MAEKTETEMSSYKVLSAGEDDASRRKHDQVALSPGHRPAA